MSFIYPFNPLFPKSWNKQKIATYAKEIMNDPKLKKRQLTGKPIDHFGSKKPDKHIAEGIKEGLRIRVVFQPKDNQIICAYPVSNDEEVVPIG